MALSKDRITRLLHKAAVAALAFLPLVAAPAFGQHIFDGNIVHGNLPTNYRQPGAEIGAQNENLFCFRTARLADSCFVNNRSIDPYLVDPFNLVTPNWRPQPWSPALGVNGPIVNVYTATPIGCDSDTAFFENVCYAGAVPPAPDDDWTTGWTFYDFDGLGRTDINPGKPLVVLSGNYNTTVTLSSTNNYLVSGRVRFVPPGELIVPAGTALFGETATDGFIEIDRGAKITAIGTRANPIIMTSEQALDGVVQTRGSWGGLVINGKAIANCANTVAGDSCASEGGDAGYFGGADDCDNSGELRYVRVEYSGVTFGADNELNCFTFNGVGRGTKCEYLQAHMGFDDLFEWFGGSVELKHAVATYGNDDMFDWQMGYRGQGQFLVAQMYGDVGNHGIEADNNEFNFDASPRSRPTFSNMTLVGATNAETGIMLRRGTDATVVNSIVIGWKDTGLDLDDQKTFDRCCGPRPGVKPCGQDAVSVDEDPVAPVGALAARVSPNPVFRTATVSFTLREPAQTSVRIFDASGALVSTLTDGTLSPGPHAYAWSPASEVPAGVYYYLVESGAQRATGRFVRLK